MFTLVALADVVQIPPSDFHKSSYRAIEDFINNKYADKVIHKVGLCVGFHSLINASEGLIGHGTGIVNVNVDFRLVVFRPFKGEIVRASITHSSPNGIALATDFYDDLVVPPETLFENSHWQKDETGKWNWVWHAGEDEAGQPVEYYFDQNESCLVRVEEEQWHDVSPEDVRTQGDDQEDGSDVVSRTPPYRIRGSMMQSGLGPTLWWTGEGAEDPPTNGEDIQEPAP